MKILVLTPLILAFPVVLASAATAAITQKAYIKASNTGASDQFGTAVAVSGNTIVVGSPGEDNLDNSASNTGAAYILTRTSGIWTQQAYLKASNTGAGDQFGSSVAISGDTVVIAAPYESSAATGVNGTQSDNSASQSGAVYVFKRTGSTWTQQAYLKASNTGTGDHFGSSVAISGNTVVVGAEYEKFADQSGAAYIFTRTGTTWTQQAYLKASNPGIADHFGASVSVSADTLVVGATGEDSSATGVNGTQSDNNAAQSGAAYVFKRTGTTWTQQAYLKASNTGSNDVFGYSVAISGDTVAVSATQEDSSATGIDGIQTDNAATAQSGAAYIFTRTGTTWTQQAYIKASNTGYNDYFGWSLALSGDELIVGAPQESSSATGINGTQNDNLSSYSGAAYHFHRTGSTWVQNTYLKASNTGPSDYFGSSVSILGGTIIVSAKAEDSSSIGVNGSQTNNSAADSGAAYIFDLNAPIPVTGTSLAGSYFTIQFTYPAGETDWKVRGSTNLTSFPDDKTADTLITEPSPGIYQAVVNVSGNPAPYFLRIER